MNLISIIFSNLLKYDAIILIIAFINLVIVYPVLRRTSRKLDQVLNPTISRPIEELMKAFQSNAKDKLDLHFFKHEKEKENLYFQIYIAITSIFPLLGILGTVIAILLTGDFASTLVVSNFTLALTSTFWGLVCAIFFRSLEGFIAPSVQQNEENLKLLLHRLDLYTREKTGDRHE